MTFQGGESDYEVIGGGVIDDRRPHRAGTEAGPAAAHDDESPAHPRNPVGAAARAAWSDVVASLGSWRYWTACVLGIAAAGALTAALVGFGAANGWFETGLWDAVYLLLGLGWSLSLQLTGPSEDSGVPRPAFLLPCSQDCCMAWSWRFCPALSWLRLAQQPEGRSCWRLPPSSLSLWRWRCSG
ncbi:hypothetical protein FV140_03175 [Paenarthrobacter ureafaciens]|uniref:hypothetical protein n=1 Tax=Paenarthrobacter ureafaciens TaxID=37931 RepID=UPI0015F65941|nr:hypothetical protein [Paenarthrobacter ureafaciens]QMU81261.1 hypothetical protein FV140_03175 [Paenarthrobacter ureafaciens]